MLEILVSIMPYKPIHAKHLIVRKTNCLKERCLLVPDPGIGTSTQYNNKYPYQMIKNIESKKLSVVTFKI